MTQPVPPLEVALPEDAVAEGLEALIADHDEIQSLIEAGVAPSAVMLALLDNQLEDIEALEEALHPPEEQDGENGDEVAQEERRTSTEPIGVYLRKRLDF